MSDNHERDGNRGSALRHRSLVAGTAGTNEVTEFTGMYPLTNGYDLSAITATLAPGGLREPRGGSFAPMATQIGLVRSARWFVGTSAEFGATLYFTGQIDGTLEAFFEHLVLHGAENLARMWGQCIGCPQPPQATARDVVEYIAAGQIKTLVLYDAFPGVSVRQVQEATDGYHKTVRFRRALAAGGTSLEDAVASFLRELAEPPQLPPGQVALDADCREEPQYSDIAQRLAQWSRRR